MDNQIGLPGATFGRVIGGAQGSQASHRIVREFECVIGSTIGQQQLGDIVVVPVTIERVPRLLFRQAVTQILYSIAVSMAAVNSF